MRKTKELDHHLKHIINNVVTTLEKFETSKEKKITYYTGNWSTDVAANFTEKQSEKIFKNMSKYMDRDDLQFFQRRNKDIKIGTWSEYGENEPETITSFEYIIIRKA